MSDRDQSPGPPGANPEDQPKSEHLNIKVTDNNNEVFFKIKRTTALSKLMNAFCDRQGKNLSSVRFLFDGARVQASDSPDSVCHSPNLVLFKVASSLNQRPLSFFTTPFSQILPPDRTRTSRANMPDSSSRCKTATHWRFTRSRLGDAKPRMSNRQP